MKNTLMYVLIAVAVLALAWKLAYPKAPTSEMIAKVGNVANQVTSWVNQVADVAKQVAKDVEDKVASGANTVASGATAVAEVVANKMAMGDNYTIVEWSVVKWLGKKIWWSHPGQISISNGSLTLKDNNVVAGKIILDMTSIKTLDDAGQKLDRDLSGPDFFDVTQFPIGEFVLTSVESGTIVGNLTLKGITKEISFPGSVVVNGDMVTVKATTNLERALWNVKGMEAVIDKYFEISFDVSFKK